MPCSSSLVLAALLIPSLLVAAQSLYSKGDAVIQLTSKTWDETIVRQDGVSVVEFYAPWCGHCKNLSPHYKTVAQKLKGIVTIAAVDCDDDANKKLCSTNGIRGFPTIKLFGAEKKKNPYTGEWYREAQEFKGASTAKGIMDAATALLSDAHITKLSSVDDYETFMTHEPHVAKVMLFTAKKETPIMYKGLSMQLHRGLDFAEVHQDVADVVSMHEVLDFPTLIVSKGGESEVYTDELKAPQLAQFLRRFASAPSEDEGAATSDEGAGRGSDPDAQPKKPIVQEVKNMTLQEAIELDEQEDMWLLGLYSPGEGSDCADSVQEFKQAVLEMQEVVKVALVAVSAEEADTVSRYGASPNKLRTQGCSVQLVLLPFGDGKEEMEDYSVYSGPLDGKALQKWVTDATPSAFTSEVSASSFQYFASSPPPGAPDAVLSSLKSIVRVLLFTNKDEVPGVFKALATNFRTSGIGFGWAQSTSAQNKELMMQFGVTKVPAVVFVTYTPAPDASGDDAMKMRPNIGQYRGALKYNNMATFMASLVKAYVPAAPDVDEVLPEVADDEGLERHCAGKGGICVLSLLDPRAEKHAAVHKRVAELALQRKGEPFHFCWMDGRRFKSVSAAFGLLPSDLPSVVALSAKRLRYATLPASDDIAAFLSGVLSGKVRTEALQRLPAVVEGGADAAEPEPNEAAGEPEVVEDEFDLSDILSEEVEATELGSKEDRLKQADEEIKAEEEARKAAASKKPKAKKSKKSKKSKSKADKSEL